MDEEVQQKVVIQNVKKVYVTGKVDDFSKSSLKEFLKSLGFFWLDNIKKIDLMIYGHKPSKAKVVIVKKRNIPIISWEEFFYQLKQNNLL